MGVKRDVTFALHSCYMWAFFEWCSRGECYIGSCGEGFLRVFLLCMGLTTTIRGVVPSGWAGCFMLRAMGRFNRSLLRFCPAFHIAIFDVGLNLFLLNYRK